MRQNRRLTMSTAADTAPNTPAFNRSIFDDPGVLFARVDRTGDEPAAEKGVVDVAVLDMNHGWANLGHESIVETLLALGRLERLRIGPIAPSFRVISYNLREHGAIPASPASRFAVVVGTGGPGPP